MLLVICYYPTLFENRCSKQFVMTRRKWNWLGHTQRTNDNIAKQPLQWTLQCYRGRGLPKHNLICGRKVSGSLLAETGGDGGTKRTWSVANILLPATRHITKSSFMLSSMHLSLNILNPNITLWTLPRLPYKQSHSL